MRFLKESHVKFEITINIIGIGIISTNNDIFRGRARRLAPVNIHGSNLPLSEGLKPTISVRKFLPQWQSSLS